MIPCEKKSQENVAVFRDQPCRTNYGATKTHPSDGGAVFSFPKDLDEQKQCLQNEFCK